jgi:hypothetical protein
VGVRTRAGGRAVVRPDTATLCSDMLALERSGLDYMMRSLWRVSIRAWYFTTLARPPRRL